MTAALFSQGQADQTPALGRHEIDVLSRHKPCADDKIALILTILIIDKDNHLAVPIILKHFFDRADTGASLTVAHC